MSNEKLVDRFRIDTATEPRGKDARLVYTYLGMRDHQSEAPIFAKAYGRANLFRATPAYLYDEDRIAGSIKGVFSEDFSEKLFTRSKSVTDHYGVMSTPQNTDHYAPNYASLLGIGIPGIYKKIEKSRAEHTDAKSQRFLAAVEITLDGFCDMIRNYATASHEKAEKATTEEARARFTRIAEDLEAILLAPPATFRQALQFIWLTYIAFLLEDRNAMAFGRMDQFLYPFYEKDVRDGVLDKEEAIELLTFTFLKIEEHRYYHYSWFGGSDVVNICIGGITRDGKDAVNELSYCLLEAVRRANIPGPNLSARLHKNTSDEFLDECLKVIATGLGYPALMNDEINIPALSYYGYDPEDVNDYCFVGCIENFMAGKQPPWSDSGFDGPLYLEPVFFRGETLIHPEAFGIDTGDVEEIDDMDELLVRLRKQLEFGISEHFARVYNLSDSLHNEHFSQPFLSVFCDDCIERAKDIRDGGAIYPTVHGIACRGVANLSDSLAAIEKLVFNEKKYTLRQFADAMKNNYEGFEEMRKDILLAPKYGNDIEFVDKYSKWYVQTMYEILKPYRTRDGGYYYLCTSTNISNIKGGMGIGASPDGRLAGTPLADTSSPMHGRDREGATAVVNSVTTPDYRLVSCGSVVNQKFSPSMLQDPEKRAKVRALIKVYFAKGGQEMQINAVSRDILKAAMVHPENYQNLVVRVSGFSAYYVDMDRSVQLDILKRTEHDGRA